MRLSHWQCIAIVPGGGEGGGGQASGLLAARCVTLVHCRALGSKQWPTGLV